VKPIAIFLPGLEFGGAERVVLNLSRGLIERGHPVHLVLAKAAGGLLAQVPTSVRIVDLNAPRALATLPALMRYLRAEQPAVLLSALPHINLLALWAKLFTSVPTRLVISDHNALSVDLSRSPRARDKIIARLAPWFYLYADEIVVVSQGVADDMVRFLRIPRTRIKVIYNPVVSPELTALAQQPLEEAWFASGQPPVILSVGRLMPQKDQATLLRALALLRKQRAARLLILGEGETRPFLETLIRELDLGDAVQMPGFVDNPFKYMARSQVFVLSSAWEGFGIVLVEALACGTQVVSTDCPSGPAEILDNGTYGRLVPVNDPEALARAIAEALDHPLPPERLRARAQDFSVDKIVAQYLDVLLPDRSDQI